MKGKLITIIVLTLIIIILFIISSVPSENVPVINKTNETPYLEYPIILVHGWLGKAIDFLSYQERLHRESVAEGRGFVLPETTNLICPEPWPKNISVSVEYYTEDNRDTGIEAYAKELNHDINLVLECTGANQVIIVSHSMGGVVSRKYMVDYGHEKVKKVITLATPHYGFNSFTRGEIILMIVDLFTGRDNEVEQLRPGSEFLEALDQADKDYRDKMVSIGTYDIGNGSAKAFDLSFLPQSDFVVKLDSTMLNGSKHYSITGCAHTDITDFRVLNDKGSIKDAWKCPEAYDIVKKEILETLTINP